MSDQPQRPQPPQRHPPVTFNDPETKHTITLLDAGATANAQVIGEAFDALTKQPEDHVIVVINRPPRSTASIIVEHKTMYDSAELDGAI